MSSPIAYHEQALIPQAQLKEIYGLTAGRIKTLRKNDPSFPKRIKFGDTRQAACYYVARELDAWLLGKIKERDSAN